MSPERSGSAKSLAYHASIGTLLHNAISWTDMATVTPRAVVHRRAGEWPQELANGSISLDFDHRHRRRFRLVTDQGDEILLDLPIAIAMADRDGLQLDDGTWFVVRAAAEPVVDVAHPEPGQLLRLAWHLGNRHVPTEIRTRTLRIRPDHVIEAMLRGFGAMAVKLQGAFQPEGGAYGDHRHGAPHRLSDHDGEL
jgi:urease accessory protein